MDGAIDMAGDWIKMRPALLTSPKVNGIARYLEQSSDVSRKLTTGFNGVMSSIVTRDVMRFVTVATLLKVWGAANEHTSDGVFKNADLQDIDDIAGIPGFGEAMQSEGWAYYDANKNTVELPNFNEYNTVAGARGGKTPAERQKEYRERKAADEAEKLRSALRNVEHNSDVEKRREEKDQDQKKPPTPKPKKPAAAPKSDFVLPNWIDHKAWDDFCAMRKSIKKPITENAKGLAVKALEKLALQGHNPDAVLNQSTLNSWQGLFEVKNGTGQTNTGTNRPSRPSLVDRVRQANAHNLRDDEPPAWASEPGAFDGEFERINEADGSLVGSDD